LSTRQRPLEYQLRLPIILSVFLSAGSGIAYEILAATTLSDLLGSSIYYFSLVIGVYLAALGIGGGLSARISTALFERLILIELVLAFLGGELAFLIIGSEVLISNLLPVIGPSGAKALLVSVSLCLVLLTGILVGLELPLFSRVLAAIEDLKGALGKAFFWDYCGGLVTAVSLPIFFLPNLGLLRTTFLMGLLNACAALILIIAVGFRQQLHVLLKVGLAMVLVTNISGVVTAHRWELFFEEERYAEKRGGRYEHQEVLVLRRSPYQKIVLTQSPTGTLRLYLNGEDQFESGMQEQVYHEALVHPAMAITKRHDQILVLGGGDGLALREILKYPDVKKVILVDIDREVIDLAKHLDVMRALNQASFFDPRVEVVIDDAFMFVKNTRGIRRYDVVVIDLSGPTQDDLVRLYSKEFYAMVRKLIDPHGVVAIQSADFLSFYHRTIFTTVKAAGFSSVLAFHPAGGFGAVTLGSMRNDLLRALERMVVPVDTSWIRRREDLARLIAYGQIPPYQWVGVQANTLFQRAILNNPDRYPLWYHALKLHIKRWFRRHPEVAAIPGSYPSC